MSGYVLGLDAEFDLDEIWECIAADSIEADGRIEMPGRSKNCSTRYKRKGRCLAPPYSKGIFLGGGANAIRFARSSQEALGRTPGMGHRREDLTPYPVLFWPVGACLIIYRSEQPLSEQYRSGCASVRPQGRLHRH